MDFATREKPGRKVKAHKETFTLIWLIEGVSYNHGGRIFICIRIDRGDY